MNSRQSPALVLTVRSHSESDKIISLLSQDFGKFTAIAKGAHRSKKRFVNKLEPFTLLNITCRPPKRGSLFFLEQAELLEANLGLRNEYRLYTAAGFICELIGLFSIEQNPEPKMFSLACSSLNLLSRKQCRADILVTFFLLHLLQICGYGPKLDACGHCGRNIDRTPGFLLSPAGGSLVCDACRPAAGNSPLYLSCQSIKFLLAGQAMTMQRLTTLRMSRQNTREALTALTSYSRHILQQDIHSDKVIMTMLTSPD